MELGWHETEMGLAVGQSPIQILSKAVMLHQEKLIILTPPRPPYIFVNKQRENSSSFAILYFCQSVFQLGQCSYSALLTQTFISLLPSS